MSQKITGKVHYRSFWLLVLLMLVLLGITSLFAIYTTRYAAESMEENLTITLTSNAKSKADTLGLWISNTLTNTNRFVDKDMIRLFCAESYMAAQLAKIPVKGQEVTQKTETKDKPAKKDPAKSDTAKTEKAPADTEQVDLKQVQTVITQQLTTFINETDFTAGGIWSPELQELLSTSNFSNKLSDEYTTLIKTVLRTGKPAFTPVNESPAGLTLTMSYPIFPPLYTDLQKDKAVAALILEIPVDVPFAKILLGTGEQSELEAQSPYRLFQWGLTSGEELQYINLVTGALEPYADWTTAVSENLPLMNRMLPNGESVYSIGVHVENYNFIITHEEPAYIAENFYANFRNFMIVFVVGAIVVTFALLWGCWWFLVGRHERNVQASMRKLSEDVSTQQQILDSINATLTDGVVLTDTLGNIRYANQSFAKMVHHDTEGLLGFKMGSILHPDAAEILQTHFDKVVKSEGIFDFEEKLTIQGKDVYWQGIYTPYFGQSEDISGVVAVYRDTTKMVLEREEEQKRIDQLIQVLTMSVGLVNPYLSGHSSLMAELADFLAQKLDCDFDERKTLSMSASLSQMGMISLPKEILNKKGALTTEERDTLRTHVTKTCEILADFDFGLPVQETILQMHENMDGTGYPHQLKGEEISMLSRILHVSNAFCAILRPRTYRKAKTLDETLNILNKDKTIYDIKVLDALNAFTESQEGQEFVSKISRKKTNR